MGLAFQRSLRRRVKEMTLKVAINLVRKEGEPVLVETLTQPGGVGRKLGSPSGIARLSGYRRVKKRSHGSRAGKRHNKRKRGLQKRERFLGWSHQRQLRT